MLERLFIRNFALIDKIELTFTEGLNVFTGETGAGKSILLGALSTVLGEKMTDDLFRSSDKTLEIDATFSGKHGKLPAWVKADEEILLIQRNADKGKKAQNFLNQRQITQTSLAELGDGLVDIHGQHQHQLLLKSSTHGLFLDSYGGFDDERISFAAKLADYYSLKSELSSLKDSLEDRHKQRDFLEFQLGEISALNLKPGETALLENERELLASAEKRAELATRLIDLISENESSLLDGLAVALKMLTELSALDSDTLPSLSTLRESEIAADEVARNLLKYRESIEYSPQRLEEINERLFAAEKLFRKHNTDENGLHKLRNELEQKLNSIELDAREIEKLEALEKELVKQLVSRALKLSDQRHKAKHAFSEAVENELQDLGMPKARLIVDLARIEDPQGLYEEEGKRYRLGENGLEETQFLFSANPGETPKPLSRIASGGELSRIMLALKTILSRSDSVPVLVFDEIDVGIGGRTAETVGKKLKELSGSKQILLVTHLAQIARYADNHFRVTKEEHDGRTVTRIEKLDRKGRIEELARMLGGEKISEKVIAHAAELLENVE